MSDNQAAFQASVHAIRTIGSRKVVQVVLESPIEQFPMIARICEHNSWVAIARLEVQPAKQEKIANKEAQRAGILCNEPRFQVYLQQVHGVDKDDMVDAARDFICQYCEVDSRKELQTSNIGWRDLQADYKVWCES